ncbi:hypothetical protein GGR52DRAFT_575085 [Hypoxylon sp. FL1284]|nr:hypothetical protein GGR52DRAFT_575085 [Hypoxylon sp. FL1284]
MAPPTNKTTFRTYEASTRLLAAVIATNQTRIKLDFKAIATHLGGGTGKDAINHRLRPIKALAQQMSQYVAQNKDPGTLKIPGGKASEKIHKLFGESTPGGISWQFRDIKALGREQERLVSEGEDPSKVQVAGLGTPSRARAAGGTKRKRAGGTAGSGGRASTKRKGAAAMSDEDDGSELGTTDYEAKDVHSDEKYETPAAADDDIDSEVQFTPTPAPKRKKLPDRPTPKKSAPASPVAKKDDSAGKDGSAGKTGVRRSLFGNGEKRDGPMLDDVEVTVVDLSGDPPARKTAARGPRVKTEPEPQLQPDFDKYMGLDADPLAGGYGGSYGDEDDFIDGEA